MRHKTVIPTEDFNLCKAEASLDEIIKSMNSQTNNKSSGNDGLLAVFYKKKKLIFELKL